MLFDFLLVSIAVGLIRRGSIKNLAKLPLKNIELIFVSFVIRYIPLLAKGRLSEIAVRYNLLIIIAAYGMLVFVIASNFHIKNMWLVGMGVLLNFLVIVANGGKMPVSISAVEIAHLYDLKPLLFDPGYIYHTAVDSATRLKYLADIIPLPPPYPKPRVFSVGDLAMGIGMFFIIQHVMLKKNVASDKII
jgi:hypothetical protein